MHPWHEAITGPGKRPPRAFFERLDDDFDTPGAMAVVFAYIREQNRAERGAGPSVRDFLTEIDSLFDSFSLEADASSNTGLEEALKRRGSLRRDGRFAEADRIREQLSARGIVLDDARDGTTSWYREAGR